MMIKLTFIFAAIILCLSMIAYQSGDTEGLAITAEHLNEQQINTSTMFNSKLIEYQTDSMLDIIMRIVYKVTDVYTYVIFEVAKLAVEFKTIDISGKLLLTILILWIAIPIIVGLIKIILILVIFFSDLAKDRKEKKEIEKLRKLKKHKEEFKT